MNQDFNIVLTKIKSFRKRYYCYSSLQGLIISVLLLLVLISLMAIIEYNLYLSTELRKILIYSLALFILIIIINTVFLPLIRLCGTNWWKGRDKVTEIIQDYFPEIKDRLKNVLELSEMNDKYYSVYLIEAALTQKSRELKIFDFKKAISFKNLKSLFYILIMSFTIVVIISFINKSFIIDPVNRIVHFNMEYEKPSPFDYILLNKGLIVNKGDPFTVKMICKGEKLPSVVYVNIEGNDFIMKKKENDCFEFEINAVTNPLNFYFTDKKYRSGNFMLNTISMPVINNFYIEIKPPSYTKIKENKLENTGDIKVHKGSEVTWLFNCFDTDSIKLKFNKYELISEKKNKDYFMAYTVLNDPTTYTIRVSNQYTPFKEIMNCNVEIIDDMFPEIKVDQITDSLRITQMYFIGTISDDFGFTDLKFHIYSDILDSTINIPLDKSINLQNFYFSLNLNDYKNGNKTVSYYFSVIDNDAVNKPKTTVSDTYVFTFPDKKEIIEKQRKDYDDIENMIKKSQGISEDIIKEIKDLKYKNINKDVSEWEKSQSVNDILFKKDQLEDLLNQIDKMYSQKNDYQSTFQEQSQEIIKKQQDIEELLKNIMTDELKKLLEEFSKLAEEFNSKMFNELSQKLDISLEDLSEQLDKNLELLKKMKLEENIEQLIKQIGEIEISQRKVAEEVEKEKDYQKVIESIEKDKSETNNAANIAKEIMKENSELKKPIIFDDFDEDFNNIEINMENTQNELEKRNRKKAKESIIETAEKLRNLVYSMQKMLEINQKEENGENILTIKRLLKNILFISLNQERIFQSTQSVDLNDPIINNLKREQKILMEQSYGIKDSLYALAKRSPKIGNVINDEILNIEINIMESVDAMELGNFQKASLNQRFIMTSANNIALFLDEVLRQMEQIPENSSGGDENCNNGNGSKLGGLKKSAESLKQQLQQMIDQMKKGDGKNIGKSLSESLMQHEIMQKLLRDMINNGGIGNEARQQLQQIDQLLEQNRKEVINHKISQNLINRHNEIMVRLLEAEKSENERDWDEKRESDTADEDFYSKPAEYFEKFKEKNVTLENLDSKTLKLNNFYQGKQRKFMNYVSRNGIQ